MQQMDHAIKETPRLPTPYLITLHASHGLTKEMIAAEFDMYEEEFNKLLKKHKDLKKAYDMGETKAKTHIHRALWGSSDTGLLLLKARLKLKLTDPVLEEFAGNIFKQILAKADHKTQSKLASVLGIR